jgi:hypothetical protein
VAVAKVPLEKAALVTGFSAMFCNFYLMKYHKIAKNSTTTKAREKNKHRFGILRILENFYVV